MLKITTAYGVLKYKADIEIPVSIKNPMFNRNGSYSMPFTVPLSPNKQILGFPASLASKKIIGEFIDCTIEQNYIKEKGTLKVIDVDDNDIELSLTTREGAFWEWAKKTILRNITTSPDRAFNVQNTFSLYFDKIWPQADMAFFPIAVSKLSTDPLVSLKEYPDARYVSENEILQRNYEVINSPQNLMRAQPEVLRKGITGFLYVNEILKWILNNYGLRFEINELADIPEMNRCVVLNSAMRPFRNGMTHLSELLPSGTVLDFVEAIEEAFCCQFYYQSHKRSVSLKLHKKTIISSSEKLNAIALPSNLTVSGQQLTLDADRINSDYTVVNNDYSEEYIRSLDIFREEQTPIRENGKVYASGSAADRTNYPDAIVFNTPTQCYFSLKWIENDSGNWEYKATVFQSRYKPYIPDTNGLEKKEIKPSLSFAPMVKVNFRQYYCKSTNVFNAFDYSMLLPQFNVEIQEYDERITGEYFYKSNVETPITFAFYRGKQKINFPSNYKQMDIPEYGFTWRDKTGQLTFKDVTFWDIPWGSIDVYTSEGIKMDGVLVDQPNLSEANIAIRWVGEYGLLENFYREYEEFLKTSGKEVNLQIVDLRKAITEAIYKKYQFDNAMFFLGQIDVTFTATEIKFDSAKGYTLKPYT